MEAALSASRRSRGKLRSANLRGAIFSSKKSSSSNNKQSANGKPVEEGVIARQQNKQPQPGQQPGAEKPDASRCEYEKMQRRADFNASVNAAHDSFWKPQRATV